MIARLLKNASTKKNIKKKPIEAYSFATDDWTTQMKVSLK
jgi:hypothetical protein